MGFVVLSYNVRHQVLDDGLDRWQHRRSAVYDRFRTASPAIVGLQESTGDQQADIEQALDYRWYGVADEPGSGEHNPVGIGGRFVSREVDTEWLSPTPEVQSVGWDASYPRVLTQVVVEDTATGRSLAVFNTHFDHEGPDARRHSAQLLRDRVASLSAGTEAVVLGDFNCRPDSRAYEILSANGDGQRLRDARAVAETVDGPTTTVTDFETLDPDRRLDHVFVTSGLAVNSYRIDDATADGRYPSDHLPVVVDVRFA